jgi:hypothetical protein
MRYPELPGPAPCRQFPAEAFDMVEYPLTDLGLSVCEGCTQKVECLKLVDPLRSYFDGIAGGYVWKDGSINEWSVKETESLEGYFATMPQRRTLPVVQPLPQDTLDFQPEPPKPHTRTRDRFDEVDHLLISGVSPEEVCKQLGLSAAALERYAYRHGRKDLAKVFREIRRRKKRKIIDDPNDPRILQIEQLLAEGKTPREIVDAIGITPMGLRNYCDSRNRNDLGRIFRRLYYSDTKRR